MLQVAAEANDIVVRRNKAVCDGLSDESSYTRN